jgi:hypothetical protein
VDVSRCELGAWAHSDFVRQGGGGEGDGNVAAKLVLQGERGRYT